MDEVAGLSLDYISTEHQTKVRRRVAEKALSRFKTLGLRRITDRFRESPDGRVLAGISVAESSGRVA